MELWVFIFRMDLLSSVTSEYPSPTDISRSCFLCVCRACVVSRKGANGEGVCRCHLFMSLTAKKLGQLQFCWPSRFLNVVRPLGHSQSSRLRAKAVPPSPAIMTSVTACWRVVWITSLSLLCLSPRLSMLLPAPLLPKLWGWVGVSNHLQSAVQMVDIRADDLSYPSPS